MTSRARSAIIRRPPHAPVGAASYLRVGPEEGPSTDSLRQPQACRGGASGGGENVLKSGSSSSSGAPGRDEREAAPNKAESVVHLSGGTTMVTLARGEAPTPQSHSSPPALGVKKQFTRPERRGVGGGAAEGGAGGAGGRGDRGTAERRDYAISGASYSRAVASEGEAAVTVTVSDSSSVDSPLLSPRRPLLHSAHSSPDAGLVQVELVEAQDMDLDSGGRFDRRATIIDR